MPPSEDSSEAPGRNGRHIAVRLNDLDATRATEATAIATALMSGKGIQARTVGEPPAEEAAENAGTPEAPNPPAAGPSPRRIREDRSHAPGSDKIERFAWDCLLGSLKDCPCVGQLACAPHDVRDRRPIGRFADDDSAVVHFAEQMKLEFVLSPVDGAKDLRMGYDGAACVLAGGPPETFQKDVGPRYFVLVVNARWAKHDFWERARILEDNRPLEKVVYNLFANFLNETNETNGGLSRHEFTNSTMMLPEEGAIGAPLSKLSRQRVVSGSPVAAATAALLHNCATDAFTAVVTGVQAVLIAVAARATGGLMLGLPIDNFHGIKASQLRSQFRKIKFSKFVGEEHFVAAGSDVFLNITGISEGLLVKGVRHRRRNVISTHTMCLRSATGSSRFIHCQHDLQCKDFYFLEEDDRVTEMKYPQLLQAFERLVVY